MVADIALLTRAGCLVAQPFDLSVGQFTSECCSLGMLFPSIMCCGTLRRLVSVSCLCVERDCRSHFCTLPRTPALAAVLDRAAVCPAGTPVVWVVLPPEALRGCCLEHCWNAFLQRGCSEKQIFLRAVPQPGGGNYGVCWEHGHRKHCHLPVLQVAALPGALFIADSLCRCSSWFSEMPAQATPSGTVEELKT